MRAQNETIAFLTTRYLTQQKAERRKQRKQSDCVRSERGSKKEFRKCDISILDAEKDAVPDFPGTLKMTRNYMRHIISDTPTLRLSFYLRSALSH